MQLILASGSNNRKEALRLARIPFRAVPSYIDERAIRDTNIRARVTKVARAKVEEVAKTHTGLILGADGVNLCAGKVLEKPKSKHQARGMLSFHSGKEGRFITGFFILNSKTKKTHEGIAETVYKFRLLSGSEIDEYVKKEPVLRWASAFSPANSMAIRFVEWVQGSYSNFNYSLPLEQLIPILHNEGILK